MNAMRRSQVRLWMIVTLAVGLAAASVIGVTDYTRQRQIDVTIAELNASAQELQDAIGYGGLIHHFKNYLLRPDEAAYREEAILAYETAIAALARIDRLRAGAGDGEALASTRQTLRAYREMIGVIRAMTEAGASAREIDAAVRINDTVAVSEVEALKGQVIASLSARHDEIVVRRIILGLLALLGFGGLIYLSLRQRAKRLRHVAEVQGTLYELMSHSNRGFVGLGADGTVQIINDTAIDLLNLPRQPDDMGLTDRGPSDQVQRLSNTDAWVGHRMPVSFTSPDGQRLLEGPSNPLVQAQAGASVIGEVVCVANTDADHPVRYIRYSCAPASPNPLGIVSALVIEDDTKAERNRQIVERTGRLEALGQFTGGIAHDFNNVLATVTYAVQIAQTTSEPDRIQSVLRQAGRAAERGSDLTQRLLSFAQRGPGEPEPVEMRSVLDDLSEMTRSTLGSRIALQILLDDDDLWTQCDRGQLDNALLNLVINSRDAILAANHGDQITVRACAFSAAPNTGLVANADGRPRSVEITVTDNGPGMDAEVRRRAVDPFFSTKETGAGSGLGLSIVFGFVEQFGGTLRIYSEPQQGTTIRLNLPLGAASAKRAQSGGHVETGLLRSGRGESVLLVDDDTELRDVMSTLLTTMGYTPIPVASAEAALREIEKGSFIDLVLTDIVMPGGINGIELVRELRQRGLDMPVIYMTGFAGYSEPAPDRAAGAVLVKPCEPVDLARAMYAALHAVPGAVPVAGNDKAQATRRSAGSVAASSPAEASGAGSAAPGSLTSTSSQNGSGQTG
ncbi:MAG: ATP-binding protein [Celeribacter sp.]|jgi:signal transduction histidine kinase/FixJ family two-component response regulator